MNKMGLFIQPPGEGVDLIAKYQPRAVMLMDARSEQVEAVRVVAPHTDVLVWWHEGDRHWSTTNAVQWADHIAAGLLASPPDVVAFWNENLAHDAFGQFADYDARQADFIDRMQDHHGIPVGGFALGEGNFTKDGPNLAEYFPKSLSRLKYIFVHEYWFPRLHTPGMQGYHCMRWPHILGWLDEAGYTDIEIYITECGLTSLINGAGPDEGWLGETAKAHGVSDQDYLDDLSQYHAYCCQQARIKAVVPFLTINYPGNQWETFRLASKTWMLDSTMMFDAPGPGEIPEDPTPPPEEDNMDLENVRVFKRDPNNPEGHIELSDLKAKEDLVFGKYGAAFRRAEVEPGQQCYRLIELWEKTGHHSLITRVVDENGQPIDRCDVAFYWRDAPDPPEPPTEVYPHDWHPNFVHGPTNVNGDVGPGMGRGAYHGEGEGGPHAVWIRDPNILSDICEKLGMVAGTNHDHLDQKFQRVVETGIPPEPTGKLVHVETLRDIEWPTMMFGIAYPPDESVDTRGDAQGPLVDLDIHPVGWTHPVKGTFHALVEFCADFDDGDASRTYTLRVYPMADPSETLAEVAHAFKAKGQEPRRRVIYVFEKEGSQQPEPGPDDQAVIILQELMERLEKAGRALAGLE